MTKKVTENGIEYTLDIQSFGTYWYYEGQLHRVDNPAVEYTDGEKEWLLHGKMIYSEYGTIDFTNYFELTEIMKKQIIKYRLGR